MPDGVKYLDGPRLQRCFVAGLDRLISERDYLNKINVFPVPDGDTGNNLYQTALTARAAIADVNGSAGDVLARLADGALDGAQGNSGAILAQFFQGLASKLRDAKRIDSAGLADALSEAAIATRSALTNPREGTIISVIDTAAATARSNRGQDIAKLLPLMLDACQQSLAQTTNMLEELRRAGVVDAGARGFVSILEGCADYLISGSIRDEINTPDLPPLDLSEHHHEIDLQYRYCTECMLEGNGLDSKAIRETLQTFGDSMVIAGSSERVRIHIHTNEPETIFELAGELGRVSRTKADDMQGQARTLSQSNREIAIVTDSAADIDPDLMAELNVQMVPLRVQFGTESYLDKLGMSPAEFRSELLHNPAQPGTSQPTQGDLRRMFEFLTTHFDAVVSVNLSAALSGTYQGAGAAAERIDDGDRVTIIDSRNVSVGQGLAAIRAAELAEAGLRGAQLTDALEEEISRIKTFAMVADLTNAVRSGRVRPFLKSVADFFRIRPILRNTSSGKVGISGFIFGRDQFTQRFAAHLIRRLDPRKRWRFAIAHGYREVEEAQALIGKLQAALPGSTCAWQTEIGSALGVHSGMEALVIACIEMQDEHSSSH